jgi:hypothetical protein
MKSRATTTRLQKRNIEHLHREHVPSRKRAERARAKGQESKEFCLAKVIGPALRLRLGFSKSGTPADYASRRHADVKAGRIF